MKVEGASPWLYGLPFTGWGASPNSIPSNDNVANSESLFITMRMEKEDHNPKLTSIYNFRIKLSAVLEKGTGVSADGCGVTMEGPGMVLKSLVNKLCKQDPVCYSGLLWANVISHFLQREAQGDLNLRLLQEITKLGAVTNAFLARAAQAA